MLDPSEEEWLLYPEPGAAVALRVSAELCDAWEGVDRRAAIRLRTALLDGRRTLPARWRIQSHWVGSVAGDEVCLVPKTSDEVLIECPELAGEGKEVGVWASDLELEPFQGTLDRYPLLAVLRPGGRFELRDPT